MPTIQIQNNGPDIVSTDYWDSEHAQKGYCYLTWNAGAARLLVPDSLSPALTEMRTAKYVIISRGKWREKHDRDALELLFEDNTDSPYSMHIVAEQSDRLLPENNQGGGFIVTVWTRAGKQLEFPGKYRKVSRIPCLKPWVEN